MKLHLNKDDDVLLIRSFADNRITIGESIYQSSVIISPNRLIDEWQPRSLAELTALDFETMLVLDPEVVLLGTGDRLTFPPASITQPLIERSIGLEVMDTSAACRTYNILAVEGRKVVASLIVESESA